MILHQKDLRGLIGQVIPLKAVQRETTVVKRAS